MIFKEQAGKVQVLLYTGTEDAKGKPVQRIVGSFDRYTYKPSAGLLDKLNPAERDELEFECARRRLAAVSLNRQYYIGSLAANMRGACESLDNNAALTDLQSEEIWDAMQQLVKALRASGHARPTKKSGQRVQPDQPELFD